MFGNEEMVELLRGKWRVVNKEMPHHRISNCTNVVEVSTGDYLHKTRRKRENKITNL